MALTSAHLSSLCCPSLNLATMPARKRARATSLASMELEQQAVATREQPQLPSSALAVATAVRAASSGELNFSSRMDGGLVVQPSMELLTLCTDQLRTCDRNLQHKLRLTIYVRSPECYGSGELVLRHVSWHVQRDVAPSLELLLLFQSDIKPSLQEVESFLAERGAVEVPEFKALVVPMAKELCLVGLLVAERMAAVKHKTEELDVIEKSIGLPDTISNEQASDVPRCLFTIEETTELVKLADNLALACVMDQRVALLQHASWQKNVKIDSLLEQARGSLRAIRTLGNMVLPQLKRGEIPHDVLEDMLLQGDRMKEVLQEIQEALYHTLGKGGAGARRASEDVGWAAPDRMLKRGSSLKADEGTLVQPSIPIAKDETVPMPPLAVATPTQQDARTCNVAEVLSQLVKAGTGMASTRNVQLQLKISSRGLLAAAVDENALRQAVSKLLDNAIQRTSPGGWIRVEASEAPAGGVLLLLEDNGPDMSFLVQAQALGPLGSKAPGLEIKLARDILEGFGVVLRITSPYLVGGGGAAGGMRVEMWLPTERAAAEVEEDA